MKPLLALFPALLLGACATAPPFDVQGHRGARGLAPENTLPAFERALAIGVTTLELDVAVTRDGVVVISHDPRVNPDLARGPDGKWIEGTPLEIHDLTYLELMKYDVGRLKPGTNYAKSFPDQVPVDGTRIPRLADLFALVERLGNRQVRFNIETKVSPLAPDQTLPVTPFTRALLAEVRKAGMASRTSIQSFDWRTLAVVQKEAPEMPTVYLTAQQKFLDNICTGPQAGTPEVPPYACESSPWTGDYQLQVQGSVPKMVKAAGGDIWSPFHRDIDAAKVAEAHALGLKVIAWTVNDPESIAKVLALGVDGIISDRPDIVRAELAKKK